MATYASRIRALYPYKAPSTSVDHLVIGGGVVGLAVAAGLVNTCGSRTTFLVERRGLLGQETTARNSEVIHSGIYYPIGSLKSKLCIRGRDLLYDRCQKLGIDHKQTQKLIVATENYQVEYLDKLSTQTAHPSLSTGGESSPYVSNSQIPTYFLGRDETRELEPDLSPDIVGALLVTSTGIVDSQGLVDSLAREIEEEDYVGEAAVGYGKAKGVQRGEGVVVRGTRVVRIDREEKGRGWVVQLESNWEGKSEGEKGDVESVRADVVVNAAGLGSATLLEGIVPESEAYNIYPVKGNYMSYKGPGVSNVSRLIYPCPSRDLGSLGTHLTLDLSGNVKFGPDTENIGDARSSRENPDFWQVHLAPSSDRLASIAASVQSYLPGIDANLLEPDYSGIRPNILPPGSGFFDFLIRHSPDRLGLIEMGGFASPGLTSALAAGEYVSDKVRKEVWKEKASVEALAEGWE
ncbi:FAD dependent oxidoreductase [Papiliotrema laurentii]|uniref:L-2-hydroxyglutarate dehydrogenase, mitochondrial n=1 Tax=Papiliotrema laurentii TaxID=5418 RepID=A0AAD9CZ63_PAPLA|nr:FAD dependent oxidoreductase [Papiliotrema laurentii]